MSTLEQDQRAQYTGAIEALRKQGFELLDAAKRFPNYGDIIRRAANGCFDAATAVHDSAMRASKEAEATEYDDALAKYDATIERINRATD